MELFVIVWSGFNIKKSLVGLVSEEEQCNHPQTPLYSNRLSCRVFWRHLEETSSSAASLETETFL